MHNTLYWEVRIYIVTIVQIKIFRNENGNFIISKIGKQIRSYTEVVDIS